MKIIGHRGAAGIALENTLQSINAAKLARVDAIEFDIRLTSDKHFVLCHDATTKRVSQHNHGIHEQSIAFLSKILLHNGEPIPSLKQALKAAGDTPVFIEVKGSGWAKQLAKSLKPYDTSQMNVIAMDHPELAEFHKLMPTVDTYAIQKFHATELFETFKTASRVGFAGIDMNFWLLNPLTYWIARRNNLQLVVYTVNHVWIARFLQILFPEVAITTNHPRKLGFLDKRHRKPATHDSP